MVSTVEDLNAALIAYQSGRFSEAENLYCKILSENPNNSDVIYLLGVLNHERGNFELACELIHQAISMNGAVSDYFNSLGFTLFELKQVEASVTAFKQAIELNPEMDEYYFNLGTIYHLSGRLNESIESYQSALKHRPDSPDTLNNLANALKDLGETEKAIEYYQQAIQADHQFVAAYYNLGHLLLVEERIDEAIEVYRTTIRLNPGMAAPYVNLGMLLKKQGKLEEAVEYYQQAIILEPTLVEAYINLGNIFIQKGDINEAITTFKKVIELKPDYEDGHHSLAALFHDQMDFEQAVFYYQQMLAVNPNKPSTYCSLGTIQRQLGKHDEALDSLNQAITLDRNHLDAYYQLSLLYLHTGKESEAIGTCEQAIRIDATYGKPYQLLGEIFHAKGQLEIAKQYFKKAKQCLSEKTLSILAFDNVCPITITDLNEISEYRHNLETYLERLDIEEIHFDWNDLLCSGCHPSFYLNYHGLDELPLKRQYGQFFAELLARHCPELMERKPDFRNVVPKIGFLVTKGHEGTFIRLMAGFLNHFSDNKFDMSVICDSQNSEMIRSAIQRKDVQFVLMGSHLEKSVSLIQEERFDIVFHFEVGTDAYNYFLPFFPLAPVQCTSWGFAVTTGIPRMTHFISSDLLEIQEGETHYTEQLVKLSTLPAYFYRPQLRDSGMSRDDFELPAGKTLYICPQNLCKLHPDFDSVLLEIIKKDSEGEVILLEGKNSGWTARTKERLDRAFSSCGFPQAMERIRFLPRLTPDGFLNLITLCDVMLDPFHVSGGMTSYEGLALGIPIVTLPPLYLRGRITQACYQAMEMSECVASSPSDYIEIAVRLGTDQNYRKLIRERILSKNHILFENKTAVDELEAFFMNVLKREHGCFD